MTLFAAYQLDPWGQEREDARAVAILLALRSGAGVKTTWQQALEAVNPWHRQEPSRPTKEQLRRKIARFNTSLCGMSHDTRR